MLHKLMNMTPSALQPHGMQLAAAAYCTILSEGVRNATTLHVCLLCYAQYQLLQTVKSWNVQRVHETGLHRTHIATAFQALENHHAAVATELPMQPPSHKITPDTASHYITLIPISSHSPDVHDNPDCHTCPPATATHAET